MPYVKHEVNSQKREKLEKLSSLKNVMKQVLSRLENGVTLQSSTDAFIKLVDRLAIVKEFYPKDPAVISAIKSESLFNKTFNLTSLIFSILDKSSTVIKW